MSSSFFKVFMPSQSSHKLSLPPAFVKNFKEEFPIEATLKDISGNLWHMDIEEDENGLSFKHGWQSFVKDYSLEYGEFLVFRYSGNSLFDVKVYGKNGCFKYQSLANNCTDKEPKVSLTVVKVEHGLSEEESRPKLIRSCKRKSARRSSGRARNSKGSCDSRKQHSPGITLDHSEFVTTRNPHFVASILLKSPYHLNIPETVLKKICLISGREMVFHTQNGKKWPVTVTPRKDGRYVFASGWKEFWMGNSLGPKDKCRFEFVYSKNRTLSKKILVTIIG